MERQRQGRQVRGVVVTLGLIAIVGALALALSGMVGTRAVPRATAQQVTPAATTLAATPPAAAAPAMNAVAVLQRVEPAVVTVNNLQQLSGQLSGNTNQPQPVGSGTGFVIDQDGHVVTNWHVVDGGDQFQVIFANGEKRPATLVGSDQVTDLAVVKVDGAMPATVALGNSDALQVGESVLAVGSPLGAFTNTATEGIVSGLNRTFPAELTGGSFYNNLVQHDAAINPGNSGGPLINGAGEVVGVNTLGIPNAQGLGFAIPSNTVKDIVTKLIDNGRVVYPFFGVSSQPLTQDVAAQLDISADHGQLVVDVTRRGPAADAGIQRDDVILAINGQPIDEQHPFSEVLFQFKPGDTITATVQSGSEKHDVQVTLTERSAQTSG